MEGWDLSPDRTNLYAEIMSTFPVGDPIIISKCNLNTDNGLLIVSNNGFAWKFQIRLMSNIYDIGKSKWIRWHDVDEITPNKNGQVIVEIKVRKKGALIVDKKGDPKIIKWKLTVQQNKDEKKDHFKEREESFYTILSEIYKKNRIEKDPLESDSIM